MTILAIVLLLFGLFILVMTSGNIRLGGCIKFGAILANTLARGGVFRVVGEYDGERYSVNGAVIMIAMYVIIARIAVIVSKVRIVEQVAGSIFFGYHQLHQFHSSSVSSSFCLSDCSPCWLVFESPCRALCRFLCRSLFRSLCRFLCRSLCRSLC